MKSIKIKRLVLENFKCHKNLILNFDGGNASIYGDNATGKTSIYDALTWLLFGKDSHGNGEKNIEIKPLNSLGEVADRMCETAVEAVFTVDGVDSTFRRTLKEVWTTKRGNPEPTYEGNTSEYFVDGVPCKKFIFSERVDSLVDEDTFRLLTSVSHFANGLSWQERREVLFKIAGVMSDEQIMLTDDKFKPLIEGLGRLSVDDYKKKLAAEKRGFTGTKTEIPARISECEKTVGDLREIDFDRVRSEAQILAQRRESLEAELLSIEHNNAAERKKIELREAQMELNNIEGENRAYRTAQSANAPDITVMARDIDRLRSAQAFKARTLDNENAYIASCEREIASSRERWIATNNNTFTGGNCPTCGQGLPATQLKAATDAFEATKAKNLREIEQTANARKEAKAAAELRCNSISAEIAALEDEIIEKSNALNAAKSSVIEPVDMPDYRARRAAAEVKINAISGELADIMTDSVAAANELRRQISDIKVQLVKQNEIIGRESLLEYSRRRIEELREDARSAAQCLEAIENALFLIEEYTRYKTSFVEDSINGMFRIARFRLFREQANGGIEDRCDVVYDGIPYINVNSGMKINLGIDIINTLSRAFGVTVPLFIDNAESVTALEDSACQIIRLVVSENDKELRVNYEN